MPLLNDQLYVGRKFLRNIKEAVHNAKQPIFILSRGIVISVVSDVSQKPSSFELPPYSLNLKIIGEDISTFSPSADKTNWFSPLLPLNFISLPEIGEEVLVIKEVSNVRGSIGYWIGRVNETAYLSRYLSKEFSNTQEPSLKYGFPFDVKKIQDIISGTVADNKYLLKKLKPGDLSIQGRSGTFNIHSFDDKNKNGLFSYGVDVFNIETVSRKNVTVTTHVAKAPIKDFVTNNFSSSSVNVNDENSLIISKADRIINISAVGEPLLYREVLGEKINKSIKDLVDEVKLLAKTVNYNVKLIMDMMENHQHTFKGTEFKTDISIPIPDKSSGVTTKNIIFNLNDQKVAKTEDIKPLNISAAIDSFNSKTSAIVADLENNLSKTQFIN